MDINHLEATRSCPLLRTEDLCHLSLSSVHVIEVNLPDSGLQLFWSRSIIIRKSIKEWDGFAEVTVLYIKWFEMLLICAREWVHGDMWWNMDINMSGSVKNDWHPNLLLLQCHHLQETHYSILHIKSYFMDWDLGMSHA